LIVWLVTPLHPGRRAVIEAKEAVDLRRRKARQLPQLIGALDHVVGVAPGLPREALVGHLDQFKRAVLEPVS
jgi:hypothetical protein